MACTCDKSLVWAKQSEDGVREVEWLVKQRDPACPEHPDDLGGTFFGTETRRVDPSDALIRLRGKGA